MFNLWDYTPFSSLGHWVIFTRLGVAMLFGAVIGLDREVKNRPAGIRTHMLVSMAAAFFAILAQEIVAQIPKDSQAHGDPVRIIEAVTAGIAFLAAGAIIRSGHEVEGVTTAAGLWLAGAVGLACGLGLWSLAAIAAGFGFVTVTIIGMLTKKSEQKPKGKAAEEPAPAGHGAAAHNPATHGIQRMD